MKPYIPTELPVKNIDTHRLIKLACEANAELARFDGLLQGMLNSELLLAPLMLEEAVQSSKIEGTLATLTDVLQQQAGMKKPEHLQHDIQEILNYQDAMRYSQDYLADRPVSLGFIRELHQMLMQSVRGADKSPGKFRETQNYIGRGGCTIEEATFVPPDPVRLMTDLEAFQRYLAADDVEILIQTAIVHAQFELLHPFLDGNGRIGRLLIPLFLFQKKKLSRPTFYISEYLEKNRDTYYARLRNISEKGDWNGWCEFFLRAVSAQARNNSEKVKRIIHLYNHMKGVIYQATRSGFSMQILDALFNRPLFNSGDFAELTGVQLKSAERLLRQLRNANIVQEVTPAKGSSPSALGFSELLSIVNNSSMIN